MNVIRTAEAKLVFLSFREESATIHLELRLDGETYQVTIGAHDPDIARRGIHINGPCHLKVDHHSMNALDVYSPRKP